MAISDFIRDAQDVNRIITPKLRKWLVMHGDDELSERVADTIYELLTTKPRMRSASFSSSGAGTCLRRQELAFLGVEVPGVIDAQLQNIFNDGKWRHLRWQAMLLEAGLLTEVEYVSWWKKYLSRGTLDGVGEVHGDHPRVAWRGEGYGFELKGVGNWNAFKEAKEIGPKDAHLDQIHRYFLSTGFKLFVVMYEHKMTQEWYEWVIEADPARLRAQEVELQTLNNDVKRKQLQPMLPACRARKGPEWDACQFAGKGGPCERSGTWPTVR